MATTDTYQTVIQIINKVERRLEIIPVSTDLTTKTHTTMFLDLLNEVIQETSDYGDWQEMFREVDVTASAGQGTYKVQASAEIKRIYEIHHSARGVSPLEVVTIQDMRRLQRLAGTGVPNQFAIVGVSGSRPLFRTYQVPGANESGQLFSVAFYKKPRLYTTSDPNTIVPFPSYVLYLGLYAKAVANEAGGEANAQYQTAYAEYLRARKEALNRYTADTGVDIQLNPVGGLYS